MDFKNDKINDPLANVYGTLTDLHFTGFAPTFTLSVS